MPIPAQLTSALRSYQRLWQPEASDADIDTVLATGFRDHRPGADEVGADEFREHRKMALDALDDLSVDYEPIAAEGNRLAVAGTVSGVHKGEFLGVPATGRLIAWRELHLFDFDAGRVAEHWMDAALLSAYLQLIGQGQPDSEPPTAVPSGVNRSYTTAEQRTPLDAYMTMVASHDASVARQLYTEDYLQHGPFGPNVSRDEFEAGNRDIVWKAIPDITIALEPFLADGELVVYRGLGQGTHTGGELFGVPPTGRHVAFTETHIVRLRANQVCEHWLQVDLLGLLKQMQP
jgi:predicted ester cyclase